MTKTLLAVALVCTFSVASAAAAVEGGSSDFNKVKPGVSSVLPFGAGKPGISINGSFSINLEDGPIKHIRQKYGQTPINAQPGDNVNGLLNPKYLTLKDVNPVIGFFSNPVLGQVWYEQRAHNTEIYSIRQIANPAVPLAPKFGGLVVAKVPDLPANTGVYFGEWAPRASNPSTGSDTNLNLASAERTVWYVGDNPTGNTRGLATATYDVVGLNQHTPGQNDVYTGALTAAFGTGAKGDLTGQLARAGDSLNFAGTRIDNASGTFSREAGGIDGRFYGAGAAALAGIAERGGASEAIAFGGKKR